MNLLKGNPYVRGEYTDYDIPPEALNDARFAAMIAEGNKELTAQIAARGMQFANGDDKGPSSIYYIPGLGRLAAMGYTVVQII